MTDDRTSMAPAPPALDAPRYVRRPDHSCCLRCWSAARLREARESAGRMARLAARQDVAGQAMGGLLIAAAVLAVGATAMAVIAGAWMRLGEIVLSGGN